MRILRTVCSLVLLSLLSAPLCLSAADNALEKEFKREISLYHIRPDSTHSLRKDTDGTPVSESVLHDALVNFYEWLYPLSPSFLKRLKIKTVIFKDSLYDAEGDLLKRKLVGDELFLDADLKDVDFYTSVLYLQFKFLPGGTLEKWERAQPYGFRYENERVNLSSQTKERLNDILAEWDQYFVSREAMYSPEMDMGRTFAYIIQKGPASVLLTGGSRPVIQKKAQLLIEFLTTVKAFDSGYLDTLLAADLTKLRKYSAEALAIRLFCEYSGRWSAPSADGKTFAPPRKIADDVEVGGQKVKPLVLALTVNDMKLFRYLVSNGADPNVSSKDGVSALQLAIRNNDPEQVRLLISAGAKVTSAIARAGTASGVNAEIVKIMNSYLPGVKQMDSPAAKPKQQSAGGRKP